ncbi:MAG: GFA family protein [Xanthobacteraceae bacterium]|nr:GFA family protein [Xanthobacteraceae bacterium]
MLQTYEGGCHCGRVRFRVSGDLDQTVYCNCSLCGMKGFLHLIVPPQQFQCTSGESELSTYQFGTKTAKHTFCKTCGVHPFYVPRSDPDKIDVNVRCIDGVDLAALSPKPFDGRNWETAIEDNPSWR